MRETDAQRFQFANDLIATRTNEVKADIADLNGDLQRVLKKIPRRSMRLRARERPLSRAWTASWDLWSRASIRCAAILKSASSTTSSRRAPSKRAFPDEGGGTFICPDGQLKIALDGVVRSIDDLPELQKPELRSVEGSEAVIEAFRRLSNTAIALVAHGKAPPSPEQIRKEQVGQPSGLEAAFTQDKAGLSDRDYIPLMIAIFVDVCILLVSVNRPFGPFFNLGQGLSRARQRGPMQGVLETFYAVFQDQFHMQREKAAPAGELIAPLQDVVFDYKGDYYAAVPLDFREENYEHWAAARANAPSFKSSRALERSRYLAAVFAILEGEKLVRLLGEEKKGRFGRGGLNGLDEPTVRAKLDKQGSMYAQADAFRIYRFQPGKWAGLLIETVGSAAARQDADRRWRDGSGEVFAGWLNRRRMQSALPKKKSRDTALLEDERERRPPRGFRTARTANRSAAGR